MTENLKNGEAFFFRTVRRDAFCTSPLLSDENLVPIDSADAKVTWKSSDDVPTDAPLRHHVTGKSL